ncbi:hypothetical protein [Pikeienuella sp. HZG-20]|uniref:hypothetical protein n=1 Tax=Paludibacillus litoralis TaxID=3133267 RepID=UPI0030EE3874
MKSNDEKSGYDASLIISDAHFEAWGRIIYFYAALETRLKIAIAALADITILDAVILTEPYSAMALRNVATSLTKKRNLPAADAERLLNIIDEHQNYSKLRNAIAHDWWTTGDRPASLRPAHLTIHGGKARGTGYGEGEPDFILEDFGRAADELLSAGERLRAFVIERGVQE